MQNDLNYNEDRNCPVYDRVIDDDLCYETALCLGKFFKVSSVPELAKVKDIEAAIKNCAACPYSNMELSVK